MCLNVQMKLNLHRMRSYINPPLALYQLNFQQSLRDEWLGLSGGVAAYNQEGIVKTTWDLAKPGKQNVTSITLSDKLIAKFTFSTQFSLK